MSAIPPSLRLLAPSLLVLVLAGCGPTPPQAPLPEAKKLDTATSGISTACGNSYRVMAFPGDHRRDLAMLEVSARSSARTLASVYHRNPDWLYQGETVTQIVRDSRSYLQECGLPSAEALLTRLTRVR